MQQKQSGKSYANIAYVHKHVHHKPCKHHVQNIRNKYVSNRRCCRQKKNIVIFSKSMLSIATDDVLGTYPTE